MIELANASVRKISTLADKTLKVELELRELPPGQMAQLMEAYMACQEGIAIPQMDESIGTGKTPSQRLRSALYVHWEQNTSKEIPFETYYLQSMERFIGTIKDRLN